MLTQQISVQHVLKLRKNFRFILQKLFGLFLQFSASVVKMREYILIVVYALAANSLCEQIQCHDVHQCTNMNSTASNSYVCLGEQSCVNSTLTLQDNNFLECRGDHSCHHIKVVLNGGLASVNSNGKLATKNGNFIFINSSADKGIEFYGYYSALNTSVICDDGSECRILCNAYGCYGNNCESTNCVDTNIVACISLSNVSGCYVTKEVTAYTEPLYDGEPFMYHGEYVYQSYFDAYTMFKNRTFACINSINQQECKENEIIINGQDYDMLLCARGNGCSGSVVAITNSGNINSTINNAMIHSRNMSSDIRIVCSGIVYLYVFVHLFDCQLIDNIMYQFCSTYHVIW